MSAKARGRHGGAEIAKAALLAVEGLSRLGTPLNRRDVARLLGMSDTDERVSVLWDLLLDELDTEGTHLNISMNDAFTKIQTGVGRNALDKPVRMSTAEAVAITKALALTGELEDCTIKSLEEAWWPKDADADEIRGMADEGLAATAQTNIICEAALAAGRAISFDYDGEGKAPGHRRALPLELSQGPQWILDAVDLDKQDTRRFRLDRMSDVTLLDITRDDVDLGDIRPKSTDSVRILFREASWLNLFDWPGFVPDESPEEGYVASGTIPYFGTAFLPAQLAATAGGVTTTSEEVAQAARAWAANLVEELA